MGKLTIDDLARLRESARHRIALREGSGRVKITVHMGTCGIAAGAREIMTAVLQTIDDQRVHDVIVTTSGCAGLCSKEPMMTVEVLGEPAPVKYVALTPAAAREIVVTHAVHGQVVRDHALALGSERTG